MSTESHGIGLDTEVVVQPVETGGMAFAKDTVNFAQRPMLNISKAAVCKSLLWTKTTMVVHCNVRKRDGWFLLEKCAPKNAKCEQRARNLAPDWINLGDAIISLR